MITNVIWSAQGSLAPSTESCGQAVGVLHRSPCIMGRNATHTVAPVLSLRKDTRQVCSDERRDKTSGGLPVGTHRARGENAVGGHAGRIHDRLRRRA